jgi:hypothetical protein
MMPTSQMILERLSVASSLSEALLKALALHLATSPHIVTAALIFPYVFNFDQTHRLAIRYVRPLAICVRGLPMYTSAECRAHAEN